MGYIWVNKDWPRNPAGPFGLAWMLHFCFVAFPMAIGLK